MPSQVYMVRHGETEWSNLRRHTGRTEIPLTPEGEAAARRLAGRLSAAGIDRVLTSPRERAVRTCALAGCGVGAAADPDLAEWDYGDYEGLRSEDILRLRPGWNLFRDGCPNGESPAQVSARADRLIGRLRSLGGVSAVFTHGHFGRVIGARWVGYPAIEGERLLLDPASLSILGYEHADPDAPVIALWNERPAAAAP
jgi:broad specificity phosphatase PhoE